MVPDPIGLGWMTGLRIQDLIRATAERTCILPDDVGSVSVAFYSGSWIPS